MVDEEATKKLRERKEQQRKALEERVCPLLSTHHFIWLIFMQAKAGLSVVKSEETEKAKDGQEETKKAAKPVLKQGNIASFFGKKQ